MLDPDRPGICPGPPCDLSGGGELLCSLVEQQQEEGYQTERWRTEGEFWPNPLKHPYIAAERRLPQL